MPRYTPIPTAYVFDSTGVEVFIDEQGVPWFAASDVCDALGIANSRDAVNRLDADEKGVVTADTPGGPQRIATINEAGLYTLILTSRKPEAKRFKRWVTHEVLPSIRKTGSYTVPAATIREAVAALFLNSGLAPWTQRFPDAFYRRIFELHGWPWEDKGSQRPGVVAHYTNDLIYMRLAPDLLRLLQERNPINEHGRRKARHHQHLNEKVGHPALERHIYSVIKIMESVNTWDDFMLLVDRIHPRYGDNFLLPLMDDLLPPRLPQ